MKTHTDAHILCPQPSVEVMKSVRIKTSAKAALKRQVKRKRAAIGTSTAPYPLLEGASTAPLTLLGGASTAPLTLVVLQYPAANFVSLDTNIVSVYDNMVKYTEAIVGSSV